jgi:BASS family bile acid:Na+ symporter
VLSLLADPTILFVSSIILGLILGGIPYYPEIITIVCLMIAMSLATTRVKLSEVFKVQKNWKALLTVLFLNFVVLGGLILFLGALFNFPWQIWAGLVVMAAVPSAVILVPYTEFLRGDTQLSVSATAVIYLLSLILTPAIVFLFLGEQVDLAEIVKILILLIIVPLFISRILIRNKADEKLGIYKPIISNLAFFIFFFTIIGVNRSVFFEDLHLVLSLIVISIIRTMTVGTIAFFAAQKLKIPRSRNVTYTLFSSYKNLGLTIVLALTLFGPVAVIPAAICFSFEIIAFIYFKKLM